MLVIKRQKLMLLLILLLMTRFGYLLPDITIVSALTTSDLALLVGVPWGIYIQLNYGNNKHYSKSVYLILFGFVISFTSSIAGNIVFGQSIALGLRPQRYFLTCLFLFFPINTLLKSDILSWDDIKDTILTAAKFQLLLYFAQFFLANRIVFLDIMIKTRNGMPRLYGDCTMITLAFLMSANDFLNDDEDKSKLNNVTMIIIILLYYLFVRQGRMITFSALLCLYVGILISKQRSTRKLALMLAGGFALILLLQTPLLQSLTSALSDTSSDQNTLVRLSSQEFYLSALSGHWLLGLGFINSTVPEVYNASGMAQGYLVVDNGIYGFLYQFGVIGLLWVLCLFLSGVINSWKHFKSHDYFVLLFFLRWVITYATNIEFYYQYYSISLVFVLVYIEYKDFCENMAIIESEETL